MLEFKNKLIVLSVVGILAVIGSLMNSRQSVVQGAGGPTVSIDPAQLPLPVKATQSGPWTVNLGPDAHVSIAGQPITVKNLDEKGRNPYQQSGATGCNGSGLCDFAFPAVPAGKRLVIEHVSANVNPNPGVGVNGTFLEGAGGFTVFSLPGTSMATPELIAVNQTVLAYFDAGQTPFYRVAWSTSSNPGAFQVTISGYLVDLTK